MTVYLSVCLKESITKLTQMLDLSHHRQTTRHNIARHRNACVVIGCLAEKLAGPSSVALLTPNILNYLLTNLSDQIDYSIVLFTLIALEKFAQTSESLMITDNIITTIPLNLFAFSWE